MNAVVLSGVKPVSTAAVETDDAPIVPLVGCCAECRCTRKRRTALDDDDLQLKGAELIEYDLETLPSGNRGQLVRLKNGGSAFGSRESLNMIGWFVCSLSVLLVS